MPRALAALVAFVAFASCTSEAPPLLRAFRVTNRAQLVGGIGSVGDVSDYVLENDRARFVILGAHGSPGPGIFGGSLADADLQRAEPEFRGGHGLDAFSELFPFANLATPNPSATEVSILESGADGREAIVRVSAAADNYMDALELLEKGLGVPMNIRMRTDYKLLPGEPVLRIETSLDFNPTNAQRQVQPMDALLEPPNIFGTILRLPVIDTAKPPPGAVAGDFLFFGNKTEVFTPEYGFDLDRKLRQIFNGGCDSVNVPIGLRHLAAEGDRVSYAYGSAQADGGQVYVPLFASSFTAVMTNQTTCSGTTSCLAGVRLTYSRLFAVGDGDAASAELALYKAKGERLGTVSGHVYDARTGRPVSGVRVFAVRDPGADVISDADLAGLPPESVLARVYEANREASKRSCAEGACEKCSAGEDPYGAPGIVTTMRTDRGTDRVHDGDFTGPLPPGKYLVFARDRLRPTSHPRRVTIDDGASVDVNLHLDPPGALEVQVLDERGQPMPGKVTIGRCLPECVNTSECGEGQSCDPESRRCYRLDRKPRHSYETCDGGTCRCDPVPFVDLSLGDPMAPDNVLATSFAGADGIARLRMRPGDYEIVVSRGLEYDIARHDVALEGRRPARVVTALRRVVDTTGWVSADYHVHGMLSHDANVTHERRILSMMAEGVEIASSSDHDAIADFTPAVRALGAERFVKPQAGLETTTVELGHFIGAPLRYDSLAQPGIGTLGRGGAIDWDGLPPGAAEFCDTNGDGVFDPRRETLFPRGAASCADPSEVTDEPGMIGRLRALGAYSKEDTVITVPHPRDGFFGYFDQFELNPYSLALGPKGTTLERLNPLVKPGFFTTDFDAIELFNGKRYDFVRTPTVAEVLGFEAAMHAAREESGSQDDLERRFATAGLEWTRRILERTKDEQDRVLDSGGFETCETKAATCDLTEYNPVTRRYACPGRRQCDMDTVTCFEPCKAGSSDPAENCFGVGECVSGRCVTPPSAPCTAHRGVVDDWFRLLNAGFAVTGVGNSDTHTTLSNESGIPRNWVASSTDEPKAIDLLENARAVRGHQLVTSYGPFVRFDVNGVGIGGTVTKPKDGRVKLRVSAESPLWFDVDRLEVYRNGRIFKEVDAIPAEARGEARRRDAACTKVDEVPNREIVNFDCAFDDAPTEDAWYVVIAQGLKGKDLRPVYTSVPLLTLEIGDITSRAFGAFGLVSQRPEVPRQNPVLPVAVTNPIWVDLAGDGFDAPVALPPENPFSREPASFPLSSAAIAPAPGEPIEEAWTPDRALGYMRRRLGRAVEAHHGHSARGGE